MTSKQAVELVEQLSSVPCIKAEVVTTKRDGHSRRRVKITHKVTQRVFLLCNSDELASILAVWQEVESEDDDEEEEEEEEEREA